MTNPVNSETVHREYYNITLAELADAMRGVPEAIFMYRPQIPDLVQQAASRGGLSCFKSYDLDGERHSYTLRVQADQNGCTPDRYDVQLNGEHTVTYIEPADAPTTTNPQADDAA